jgi:hypothetical protein
MNEATNDTMPRSGPPASRGDRPLGDRLLGFLGTLLIVVGVGFAMAQMVSGALAPDGATPAEGTPQLRIVEPVGGPVEGSPLEIVFESPLALTAGPMGWQAGALHLHAEVNGREVMPGARDIVRLGGDLYRWQMRVPQGELSMRLFWAGADHRPLEAGASPRVELFVR